MPVLWTGMHEHGTTTSPRPFLVVGALALATVVSGAAMLATGDGQDVTSAQIAPTASSGATTSDAATTAEPAAPDTGTSTAPASVAEVTTVPTTEPAPDPDADVDPEPGSVPEGLEPLDLTEPEEPAPFDGIVQAFAPVDLPQPTPQPTPVPTFEPFVLTDGGEPTGGMAAGGLTFTAATGCGDHCISDATVSTAGGSSSRYDLRVELENPADVEAFLSFSPIVRTDDGGHLPPSSVPTASGSAGFAWTTSFDLEPATVYHLLVRASDEQGMSSVAGTFTTAEAMGPATLAAPSACADGCLEFVSTEFADDGTELAISVRVEVDTTIEFAWSTDQFVQGANGPTLTDPSTQAIDAVAGSITTLRLGDRTPNTAYSVMATATDGLGGTDRIVGRVATPSPTITAGISRVHISGDGDDGRTNRGEIRFSFGTIGGDNNPWGYRGEEKLSSNTTIRLGRSAGGALQADGSGHYPSVQVFAGERDGSSLLDCFVSAEPGNDWRPDDTVTWCNRERTTWSNTYVPSMTLAEIEQLPTCEPFGVEHPDADRCAWVHTNPNSSDQVSFDMVVWFDID